MGHVQGGDRFNAPLPLDSPLPRNRSNKYWYGKFDRDLRFGNAEIVGEIRAKAVENNPVWKSCRMCCTLRTRCVVDTSGGQSRNDFLNATQSPVVSLLIRLTKNKSNIITIFATDINENDRNFLVLFNQETNYRRGLANRALYTSTKSNTVMIIYISNRSSGIVVWSYK